MSANTIGHLFRVTTFGESHGTAIGCVIDGCPPKLPLDIADIQPELDRRRPGRSRFVTQRQESDSVEILSGVFDGQTTGTPIALLIRNTGQRSKDYGDIAQVFRPGHADYTYWHKYGVRDYRGGGRSSARETAARVAAGAVAKKWLNFTFGVAIRGCLSQLDDIAVPFVSWDAADQNDFFAPNAAIVDRLADRLDDIRRQGDSCGAKIQVVAESVPVGWGSPVFDRLDATIAHAMMGINAVKGVEIGDGFAAITARGSAFGDEITPNGFLTNHAGGILGGVSSGQPIVVTLAIKPTPSISTSRRSVDTAGRAVSIETHGRHDPCVGIRAVPVAEAMLAIVLADAAMQQRAQNETTRITPRF